MRSFKDSFDASKVFPLKPTSEQRTKVCASDLRLYAPQQQKVLSLLQTATEGCHYRYEFCYVVMKSHFQNRVAANCRHVLPAIKICGDVVENLCFALANPIRVSGGEGASWK